MDDISKSIQRTINETEKKMQEVGKKLKKKQATPEKPKCARCKEEKKCKKHHWPLGSLRLVLLCNHCYNVVKKQRSRRSKFWGGSL